MNRRRRFIRLIIYAALPVILWFYVHTALEISGSVCLVRAVTGVDCPSCGATRALYALLHGSFRTAWESNPVFTAGVFPLAFGLILQDILLILFFRKKQSLIEFVLHGRMR